MNKIKRIGIVGVLTLALSLSINSSAMAALTMSSTAVTSGAALTLDGAAGSNVNLGAATVGGIIAIGVANTGGINIGAGNTAKTIAIGTGTAIDTINIGTGIGADVITIGNVVGATTLNGVAAINAGTGDALTITANAASTWKTTDGALLITNTGTADDDDVDIVTTTEGDIDITSGDDVTVTATDDLALVTTDGAITMIPGAVTNAVTIGNSGATTGATTIYGGSLTNAVQINANVGAVASEAHGLDVVADGELSSGDNLVGVNSVLTPTGTGGAWTSAVYGKVIQGASKHTNGYISGGEFEVVDTNASPSEVHTLVLDGNSTVFSGNSSYIWGQTFGTTDMPNLLKLTGLTSGTGNMWYGPTLRIKIGDSSVASRYLVMSEAENKLDLGDSDGIDIGTAATGLTFTGGYTTTAIQLGTSGSKMTLAAADDHAIDINTTSASVDASTSVRPIHMVNTMTGTGGVGGRAEFEMNTTAVLGGWANALKGYTDFGGATADSGGSVTGLGSAVVAEMRLPRKALTAGNYAPLEVELVVQEDGTTGGVPVSFMHAQASGDATALADFNDNGYVMSLQGLTAGEGDVFEATTKTAVDSTHSLRILIGGTAYYIPLNTSKEF